VNKIPLDLHCHSTHSDGIFTVQNLLEQALDKNLKVFSITDHDTLEGSKELLSQPEPPDMSFIPGVEINTGTAKTEEYHILGYFIDPFSETSLKKTLQYLKEARKKRIIKMIEKISQLGYQISLEEIINRPEAKKGTLGRPIIARVLVEKKYFPDVQAVFDKLLAPGTPGYVPREKIMPENAIKLIVQSGGVPVLAHPFQPFTSWKKLEQDIKKFVKLGLQGIEYYYSYNQNYPQLIEIVSKYQPLLKQLVQEYELVTTAGSDYHGDRGVLGTALPKEELCKLYELKKLKPPLKLNLKC